MNVIRTIEFHLPPEYDDAALRALNWVNKTGGTLLFMLPRDKKRSLEYFKKHKTELVQPPKGVEAHIEVAHGDNFSIWGPRVAAINIDDLGMSRVESDLEDNSVNSPVEELRLFARELDKDCEWVQQYDPDDLSATV